jgi:hypothetical protein
MAAVTAAVVTAAAEVIILDHMRIIEQGHTLVASVRIPVGVL